MDPLSVRDDRQAPLAANEVKLMCGNCYSAVHVQLGWSCSPVMRQEKIKAAVEEHRKVCSASPPEAHRVYEIHYPRK